MPASVFAAVLFAALLHAGWNALVKLGLDRFSSILFLALVQGGIALLLLPFFEPPARPAWSWVVLGSALHSGYKLFLIRAYGYGDLSQVYPLARGAAPLIVTLAGALFLNESLGATRTAAVLAIAGGIILMARSSDASQPGLSRPALLFALGTACFTASYTMAAGVGRGWRALRRGLHYGCSSSMASLCWSTGWRRAGARLSCHCFPPGGAALPLE